MISKFFFSIIQILPDHEGFFIAINSFIELAFGFMKYIFFGILFNFGILGLFALRRR